jgi:DNA-binding CsgD family transcriptional regulator/tetratricopeptide (TPR) repeat protein
MPCVSRRVGPELGVLEGRADDGSRAEGGFGSAGPGRVVGRAGELAVVRGLAREVAAGVGGVLLVTGEQGIGKSALLRAGLSGAQAAGCRVVWGAADELDQMFPLWFIGRCLAEAAAGLPGADGGPAGGDADQLLLGGMPAGDPVRAGVERVLAVVDRLCAVSPVVLVAEDLQWADEASLEVWRRLSGAVEQLPLLLAGSFRPAPSGGELEGLRRAVAGGRGTVAELGPLPVGEVAELAAGVLMARPGRRLAELAGHAGGNPLYVRELLDALVRDGRVAVDAGVAELAAEPGKLPPTLAAAIADRLGVLPGEVLRLLRCAAVLGHEFSLADLALMTGLPAAEVRKLAELAATAGMLAREGEESGTAEGALGFRHGLIRQAVYEQLPAPVRGALHGQAARVLAGAGATTEQVAAQLVAAPGGGEWETAWLARVAPVLVHRAPQVAERLLRRAVARLLPLDPRREVIEVGLLTAVTLLLDQEEVERVARPLRARTADPDRYAEVSWLLCRTLTVTGRAADGLEVVDETLARSGISEAWAARLLGQKAVSLFLLGHVEQAEQVAPQALDAAERAGDRFATGLALHCLSVMAGTRRDQATALAYAERGLEALRDDPQGTDVRLLMLATRGSWLENADRLDEAGATIREAMALAERSGTGTHRLALICTAVVDHYLEVGRWDDALAMLQTIDGIPDIDYLLALVHGQAALIAAHRDDWGAAHRHLAAVRQVDAASPVVIHVSHRLLRARALAAERAGDLPGAVAVLATCLAPDFAAATQEGHLLLPSLARLATAAGDAGTARAAAEAAEEAAAAEPLPVVTAAADVCRGVAESDPGPLLSAAEYYWSTGRPLARAEALEEAAVLLAGRGEVEDARRAFAGSAASYQGLGAVFDLRRADVRLRALGIRRARPGRRQAPAHGWEALTPTERVIAGLVAQGRSNPDIAAELVLSRSTVQTHVSHILAKLGARSRAHIIRYALPV